MNASIWIAYNADGDIVVSTDDGDSAMQNLMDDFGSCGGTRVIEMKLTLPEIKATVVEGVVPDKDGPITLTIS